MQNNENWSPAIRQPESNDITTWELPDGAIARLGQGQMMDDITPQPIAPSPDGRYIAVGNTIGVWWYDLSTMTPITLWDTGRGWITAISFSPNGKWLATGDGEGIVKVWDVKRGACISRLKRDETKKIEQNMSGVNFVSHLVFSPDSQYLASSANADYIVYVWHTETGDRVAKYHVETNFRWFRGKPRPIAFSADGSLLACTMPDYNLLACADSLDRIRIPENSFNYIAVWNLKNGKQIACLTEPTDSAVSLCFSPCGKFLASSGQKGTVKVWTLTNWELTKEFHNFGTEPKKVFYSPEGVLYAAEVSDDTLTVWNVEREKKSDTYLEEHHGLQGNHSPKKCPFVYVTGSEFRVWKVSDSQPKTFSYSYISVPYSLAFSQDGKTLAASSPGNTLMFWDTANLSQPSSRFDKARGNFIFSTSPMGKLYATEYKYDTTGYWMIRVWELANDKTPIAFFFFPEQGNRVGPCSSIFAPVRNLIACGDTEGTLYVWDVEQQEMLHQLKAHTARIPIVAFSPNEKQLVSISFYGGTNSRLWDVESGEAIDAFPNKTPHIAFSPCSTMVACCGEREILLWDIEHREMLKTIPQPKDSWELLYALAFSPCGRYLVSGTWWDKWMDNMLIRLWDIASGENIVTFRGHSSDIQDLAFSPDGTILASGSYDKTILLWDLKPYIGS